jgi:hypothetical protein
MDNTNAHSFLSEHAVAADFDNGAVTARDSGVHLFDLEVVVPDGGGGSRSLIVKGRAERAVVLRRCADHLIAHGICIDCTRAASRRVWAA